MFLSGQFASFSPHGFYLPTALPNTSVIPLAADLSMTVSNGSTLVLKENSVLYQFSGTPCSSQSGWVTVLIPKTDLAYADGIASIRSLFVHGDYPSDVVQDTDGYTWYCPIKK